jgi:hypothetical protein
VPDCKANRRNEGAQEEMKFEMEDRAKARQAKADSKENARHEQFIENIHNHIEVLLEGWRSCGIGTIACQVPPVACPDNSKAGLKEREAVVNTFEQRSSKMNATDLEANPEETEATVVQQDL